VSKDKRAPGWLLDEEANAGRENLDPLHVWRYDQKEDAQAEDELAILTRLGLSRNSVVVDLGAGTGQFALAAARVCGRVVAVEVSPVMLEALMRRVNAVGVTNVDVVGSGFLTYEHEGPLADFAYSRYALHHLPDFWKAIALDRIRRILRPGGVFRLWDVVVFIRARGCSQANRGLVCHSRYEIDSRFDPNGAVPPEGIKGAWKVGDDGVPTGEYQANPRYKPTG